MRDNAIIPGGRFKNEDPCRRCRGKGIVPKKRVKGSKVYINTTPCPRCWGEGRIVPVRFLRPLDTAS